ncbi:hypothetical protein EV363DRAFT_1291905 [Boletus edulis]|nr:hypothetical protein EV363DRAFT_1291905 [Boletus edulis]
MLKKRNIWYTGQDLDVSLVFGRFLFVAFEEEPRYYDLNLACLLRVHGLKKERGHHDVADRTHAILKTLLGGTPLKGQKVDFLLICWNPEGLFWAGDTALETISAGSFFRFDDLKAFMYRIEDRSVTDPTTFQLAINYRLHGGIVNCAHTIIERITHFWPHAIDGLQPEHGIVDGLKPVFFRGWDQDTVRFKQFLFGKSGGRITFGAQQCIIVRDDEAVEKLRKEVGEIGLIMTLYDSKGLEFDDVLLYNFFEDSAVDVSRWRVLLNHMEGEVDGQDLAKVHAPSFSRDEGRFAAVCSELKLLYMGITRARKNLWIFDKSDKSEPMRLIWTSRNQVQNCTPGTDVPHLAVSSEDEWESFGHDLFKHKRYPQAMHCFARASLPRMVAICEAFHLRELARAKVGVAPPKAQQDAFLTAANAFVASAGDAPPGNVKLQYYSRYIDADTLRCIVSHTVAARYETAPSRAVIHVNYLGISFTADVPVDIGDIDCDVVVGLSMQLLKEAPFGGSSTPPSWQLFDSNPEALHPRCVSHGITVVDQTDLQSALLSHVFTGSCVLGGSINRLADIAGNWPGCIRCQSGAPKASFYVGRLQKWRVLPRMWRFVCYRNAAECYVCAGDDHKAADAYLDAKEYD